MNIQIIENKQELKAHINALIALEPRFAPVYEQVGVPDLRHNAGGFEFGAVTFSSVGTP